MARTETRMAEHPVVLCLQDTTELDFNGQAMDGLGRLSCEAQRGMYLHPTSVVTPQRLPLGILDLWMRARPLGTSESQRWIEGYARLAERAGHLPATRLVYVADREADILDLTQRAHTLGHPANYLLRAQHNRCLPQGGKQWQAALAATPLGDIEFTVPERLNRPARRAPEALCPPGGFAQRPGRNDTGELPEITRKSTHLGVTSEQITAQTHLLLTTPPGRHRRPGGQTTLA